MKETLPLEMLPALNQFHKHLWCTYCVQTLCWALGRQKEQGMIRACEPPAWWGKQTQTQAVSI